MTLRSIADIARDIRKDWNNINYAALPYLEAMARLGTIEDKYGFDSARSIVLYFLGNAGSWRGPIAKSIKLELKNMLK